MEQEYGEAAVQVLDILNHMSIEEIRKIPQSFIDYLTNISNRNYRVRFNHEQPLKGLNLTKQAKELLGFIYITWWCEGEEKEKYKKLIKEKNVKKESYNIVGYDTEELFKRNKSVEKEEMPKEENIEETGMIKYKENIFKKLFKKFINFFE